MIKIFKGSFSGTVTVDTNGLVVKKFIPLKGWSEELWYILLTREVSFLKLLEAHNVPFTPRVKSFTNDCITMSYCGERVNAKNLPSDYLSQASNILKVLAEVGINHNDIKPSDLLVKDGQLFLIDFGWATIKGEEMPSYFPKKLIEEKYRSPKGFNDEFSLKKSLEEVKNGIL